MLLQALQTTHLRYMDSRTLRERQRQTQTQTQRQRDRDREAEREGGVGWVCAGVLHLRDCDRENDSAHRINFQSKAEGREK